MPPAPGSSCMPMTIRFLYGPAVSRLWGLRVRGRPPRQLEWLEFTGRIADAGHMRHVHPELHPGWDEPVDAVRSGPDVSEGRA